jgi:uncharacterized protein (DUF2384 family)
MEQRAMGTEADTDLGTDDTAIVLKAATRAADWLRISDEELSRIIGTPDVQSSSPSSKVRRAALENALCFVRIFQSLSASVGGHADTAISWLDSPNTALQARPRELMQSDAGRRRLLDYLENRGSL